MNDLKKIFCFIFCLSLSVFAEDTGDNLNNLEQSEAEKISKEERSKWRSSIQEKYGLSQKKISKLRESGISYPGIIFLGEFSLKSSYSFDQVLKLRIHDKMGWGKIAKTLGVKHSGVGSAYRQFKKRIRGKKGREFIERKHRTRKHVRKKRRSKKTQNYKKSLGKKK